MAHQLPPLSDDDLVTEEIGDWGQEKYRLLSLYAQMFAASMKNKWNCRVYIDLFAGSGRSKIKGTNRLVAGSPLVALGVDPTFDKYIFCEKDPDKLLALKTRVSRDYRDANVDFQPGDANVAIADILQKIPKYTKDFKVLSFCFVDPYNLKDLAFDTIDRLSKLFVDFLVLIATDMDAARNVSKYELPQSDVVERFLGVPTWRAEWRVAKDRREGFSSFLMQRFSEQMEARGYIRAPIGETKLVRSTEKNLPLYRLALFSRHQRGKSFWEQAKSYSDNQLGFKY
ncbi:MAG TPA: three-Cys-motif partner protein TcmP [Pyrinomonadaceae bacterium]|nr:three-Cys-motif partner protein TcmP [Pyrinomonadaceae bacterium]